jgi:hypothetical protein
MDSARGQSWFRAVIFVGALYALVGIAFALPSNHVGAWRLAAWVVSGVAYAIHLAYERFRLRHSSLSTALHVALAAAFGALGLAIQGIIHSFSEGSSSHHHRLMLVALVAWPVITGAPAFLVGLGVSGLLARLLERAGAK